MRKIEKLQDKFKHQLEILDANSKHLKQEVAKIRTSVYKGMITEQASIGLAMFLNDLLFYKRQDYVRDD